MDEQKHASSYQRTLSITTAWLVSTSSNSITCDRVATFQVEKEEKREKII
jgi:hypothetical protein